MFLFNQAQRTGSTCNSAVYESVASAKMHWLYRNSLPHNDTHEAQITTFSVVHAYMHKNTLFQPPSCVEHVSLDSEKCWRYWPALHYRDPEPDNQGRQPGPSGVGPTLHRWHPHRLLHSWATVIPLLHGETELNWTWRLWSSNRQNSLQWFKAVRLFLKWQDELAFIPRLSKVVP